MWSTLDSNLFKINLVTGMFQISNLQWRWSSTLLSTILNLCNIFIDLFQTQEINYVTWIHLSRKIFRKLCTIHLYTSVFCSLNIFLIAIVYHTQNRQKSDCNPSADATSWPLNYNKPFKFKSDYISFTDNDSAEYTL